jgi:LPS-assembly lipoprotein
MWSPELRRVLWACVAIAGLGMGGCTSVRPLYGDYAAPSGRTGAAGTGGLLARIAVPPIPNRDGVQLRNDLIFELTGGGAEPANPLYRLDVSVSSSQVQLAVQPGTGLSLAAQLVMTARYTLVPLGGGPPITSGVLTTRVPFERGVQRFANVRAQRDAEDRAARELAGLIRNVLAATLARGS